MQIWNAGCDSTCDSDCKSKMLVLSGFVMLKMLANLWCFIGEKDNAKNFSNNLADLCDVYVFDAFGASHRAQSSTYGAILSTEHSCAGLLVEKEVASLSKAFKSFNQPLISIVGGSKVSTKLSVLQKLSDISDHIIVGGGIANTFLMAQGYSVGNSLVEEDMLEIAKEILKKGNCILPTEVFTAKSLEDVSATRKSIDSIEDDDMILDISIDQNYATTSATVCAPAAIQPERKPSASTM